MNQICKWIVMKCIYPLCYFIGSRRKAESDKILFVENHGEVLTDNYTLLYEELEKQGYRLYVHYLRVASSSWLQIIPRTVRLIWDMSNAGCVFLNESNSAFGAFDLRSETKLVQLWHACGAFKKWGNSVADKRFGDDRKSLERYSGHRNYSLVPVSGKAVCWAYEEAFGLENKPDVVQALGVSRTDVYFLEEKKQQAYEKLKSLSFPVNQRKILLYAPTFRGDIRNAKSPDQLDVQLLSQLRNEYVIFVKQHPFVRDRYVVPDTCKDFCIEIGNELSIEELLMTADVCVTDYSSIVFEYSLMKKPILFLAHDLHDYYDERGFYYPYEEFVPGPIVTTTEELVQHIRQLPQFDRELIDKFASEYMSGCDGHSTERIVEYVISGH